MTTEKSRSTAVKGAWRTWWWGEARVCVDVPVGSGSSTMGCSQSRGGGGQSEALPGPHPPYWSRVEPDDHCCTHLGWLGSSKMTPVVGSDSNTVMSAHCHLTHDLCFDALVMALGWSGADDGGDGGGCVAVGDGDGRGGDLHGNCGGVDDDVHHMSHSRAPHHQTSSRKDGRDVGLHGGGGGGGWTLRHGHMKSP